MRVSTLVFRYRLNLSGRLPQVVFSKHKL